MTDRGEAVELHKALLKFWPKLLRVWRIVDNDGTGLLTFREFLEAFDQVGLGRLASRFKDVLYRLSDPYEQGLADYLLFRRYFKSLEVEIGYEEEYLASKQKSPQRPNDTKRRSKDPQKDVLERFRKYLEPAVQKRLNALQIGVIHLESAKRKLSKSRSSKHHASPDNSKSDTLDERHRMLSLLKTSESKMREARALRQVLRDKSAEVESMRVRISEFASSYGVMLPPWEQAGQTYVSQKESKEIEMLMRKKRILLARRSELRARYLEHVGDT
ncbi:hypothetical protein AAMO2058_000491900 [Amorphochlora amoebiformis]